jgi:hypothetical protein
MSPCFQHKKLKFYQKKKKRFLRMRNILEQKDKDGETVTGESMGGIFYTFMGKREMIRIDK